MQLCEICKEPAGRRVTMMRHGQSITACYCYVHAAEANLLELPLDLLRRVATETGYPVNGLVFVLESLTRAGCVTGGEAHYELAPSLATPRTALEICVLVSRAAVERFQQQAGLVLGHWRLSRGKDLHAVLTGLGRSGALIVSAGALPEGLSTMEGPLIADA